MFCMGLWRFEPLDILEEVLRTARQLEFGRREVENQYRGL
jgi:hydrogenase maturation factor